MNSLLDSFRKTPSRLYNIILIEAISSFGSFFTFVASMAEPGWKVKNTFFLATALAVISYLAFIKLLKLQFPVWPVYFTA